jgi:hypothetical protein
LKSAFLIASSWLSLWVMPPLAGSIQNSAVPLAVATGLYRLGAFVSFTLHLSHPVRISRGSAILSIPRSPQPRFLPLNQRIMHSKRVTETDAASSITTVTLASLAAHPHSRHPSRPPTFRGDQAPRIYVHPTEGARSRGRCFRGCTWPWDGRARKGEMKFDEVLL